MSGIPAHLSWAIIRNNNAFIMKRRNITKPFSTEPNNLSNLASFRFNGLIHKKTIGIEPAKDNKGFQLVWKKTRNQHRLAKLTNKTTMKAGPRRSLYKLRKFILKNGYRKDLTKAALRRASAVLKSQRPLPAKKIRPKKTE
ncbi:large ribosomal subunit protein eL28 [Neocloeon triangulifer]|uniref:large ribosomal subunit protein eL28 n=1 Tax=Neocloeon triangulifer TaxID=2078957 RepID=UPI00286EF3AE|nr:large ribosomal subunit protein eL28 [Neocloeon triangulifer]